MEKSDLKFGDLITLRNGRILHFEDYSFYDFKQLDDCLKYEPNHELDIMKVQRYVPIKISSYTDEKGIKIHCASFKTIYSLATIYERKEEIIEEDTTKGIEKLNLDTDRLRGKENVRAIDYLLEGKINEIIEKLNELEK